MLFGIVTVNLPNLIEKQTKTKKAMITLKNVFTPSKFTANQLVLDSPVEHAWQNSKAIINSKLEERWGFTIEPVHIANNQIVRLVITSEYEFCNDMVDEVIQSLHQDVQELTITRF